MFQRSTLLALFATLATAAAVVFLAISIDPDVYAPGARTLARHLPATARSQQVEPDLSPGGRRTLFARTMLRKFYSVVAFAIVGFFTAPLLRRPVRLRLDVATIAGFSLLIELVQKLAGSHESYASNLFDIACGAAGGLMGALAWNAVSRPSGLREVER